MTDQEAYLNCCDLFECLGCDVDLKNFFKEKPRRRHFLCFLILIFLILFVIGIVILATSPVETKCPSNCLEKSCLAVNHLYYPCDCGATCNEKVTTGSYAAGASLLSIGLGFFIIGMWVRKYARKQKLIDQKNKEMIEQKNKEKKEEAEKEEKKKI